MALQMIFGNLVLALQKLSDSVDTLSMAIGDKPPGESALADGLEDQVLTIRGALEECRATARRSRRAAHPALHFDHARKELAALQSQFEGVGRQYTDLASYEQLRELERQTSNRRGEWPAWGAAVIRSFEDCRARLENVSAALAQCWQELAEHASTALGAVGEQRKLKRKKR